MIDPNQTWDYVIAILLASAGGLARLLNIKDEKALAWSGIFSELFVSGFAGLMVLLFARSFGLSGDWLGLVCGMAGWTGPKILNHVAAAALAKMELGESRDAKKSNRG